ncbi:MAG: hypothetical protein ABI585_03005, partial [Betaproteobacteria bacterium]
MAPDAAVCREGGRLGHTLSLADEHMDGANKAQYAKAGRDRRLWRAGAGRLAGGLVECGLGAPSRLTETRRGRFDDQALD